MFLFMVPVALLSTVGFILLLFGVAVVSCVMRRGRGGEKKCGGGGLRILRERRWGCHSQRCCIPPIPTPKCIVSVYIYIYMYLLCNGYVSSLNYPAQPGCGWLELTI